MSDHANTDGDEMDRSKAALPEGDRTEVSEIEAYDTDDGVVFYDAQNPLAWVKANTALTLKEQV